MSEQDSSPPAGFRVIPGYPRYAIDENGTVLSVCGNRPWTDAKRLGLKTDKYGYYKVVLSHGGLTHYFKVHTLVLTMFVGPRPHGMECRHLDGCKTNNHVDNLAWGTSLENEQDKLLHGTDNQGERHGKAKLTASDVLEIRRLAANGETQSSIAKNFPVTRNHISYIVNRRTWKHI